MEMKERKEIIVDTSIVFTEGMTFEVLKKILKFIIPQNEAGEIVILDSVFNEIEIMKKGNNERAQKLYSDICLGIEKGEIIYKDVDFHERGVDGTLVEYCVNNNAILLTADKRLFIRYASKMKEENQDIISRVVTEKELKSFSNLYKTLDKISEDNLSDILKIVLGLDDKSSNLNCIDIVDFIELSASERYIHIVDFMIDNSIENKNYTEEFKKNVKENFKESKNGTISSNTLKKALKEITELKIGKLNIKKDLLSDKFKECIAKFLSEKGFLSFSELQKSQPFQTEEELVKGIVNYYS